MIDDVPPPNRSVPPNRRTDPTGERDDVELTPSVCFDVLSDKRSRFALYLLEDRGGTIAVDELTARFADWERETTDGVSEDIEEGIYLRLHHVTLPKLAGFGLVIYDPDSGAVTLSERCDRLQPYLEFARVQEFGDVKAFLERCRRDSE